MVFAPDRALIVSGRMAGMPMPSASFTPPPPPDLTAAHSDSWSGPSPGPSDRVVAGLAGRAWSLARLPGVSRTAPVDRRAGAHGQPCAVLTVFALLLASGAHAQQTDAAGGTVERGKAPARGQAEESSPEPKLRKDHACYGLWFATTLHRGEAAHTKRQVERLERLLDCLRTQEEQTSAVASLLADLKPILLQGLLGPNAQGIQGALEEAAANQGDQRRTVNEVEATAQKDKEKAEQHLKFAGSSLGFAFAGAHFFGEPLVTEARLDASGRVRTVATLNRDIRVAAVYSKLPWTWKDDRVGLGPLVVLSPGFEKDQGPATLGAGLTLAVKSSDRGSSLGIGLVYALDAEVPVLREDFVPGEKAPLDEMDMPMAPQYRKRTRSSLMLVVSYSPARAKGGG